MTAQPRHFLNIDDFTYEQLRGMLDLADNYSGVEVVTPPGIVRRDGDDPYIVAAADKGTATFSDIANGLSAEYGFWLGDAFASGGSAGYDHKGMGITARGAWVMIDRHFQEVLGRSVQDAPFDMVGVGESFRIGGDDELARQARAVAGRLGYSAGALSGGGGGSDHASFAQAGVPSVFFHVTNDPNYHTANDKVEFLDAQNLERVMRTVVGLLDELR